MKVLVTGGSGIVGHYVIDELYRNGHEVINADVVRMTSNLAHSGTIGTSGADAALAMREGWPRTPTFFEVDVTDYGQVISAMGGCDAVIALGARPSAGNYTEEDVFRTNTTSMWNVCRAAEQLGIPAAMGRLHACKFKCELDSGGEATVTPDPVEFFEAELIGSVLGS